MDLNPIHWIGIGTQVDPLQQQGVDFQNNIRQGKPVTIEKLVSQGVNVNQPLPNGEMPLHFAVCMNQPEVVKILLALGADSEIKDTQNLSASDHAVLMKNESLLTHIIGNKIGKEVNEVQELIKCKASAAYVSELQTKIQKLTEFKADKINSLSEAALKGNIEELSAKINGFHVDRFDAHGLSPMHYAIIGNKPAAVALMLQHDKNLVNMMTKSGDSLLHFAAINGSKEIITLLMNAGIDVNHKNNSGQTALHYAAAKENLNSMELLVKEGADPSLKDNRAMSALSLVGTSAYTRDPLGLSKTQMALMATSALFWMSRIAINNSSLTYQAKVVLEAVNLAAGLVGCVLPLLIAKPNQDWKSDLSKMFIMAGIHHYFPIVSLGYQVVNVGYVAHAAFKALGKCWKNATYRPWAAARNIVVHTANTAGTAYLLYSSILNHINANNEKQRAKEEEWRQKYQDYSKKNNYKQENNYKQKTNYRTNEQIEAEWKKIEIKFQQQGKISDFKDFKRICNEELDTTSVEDALKIISPKLTMDDLRSKGMKAVKGPFRKLMPKFHQDKTNMVCPPIDGEPIAPGVRISHAYTTLEDYVKL